ncbi:MAG: hypothetical protein Q4G54_08390 [Pelistega sp.]|nr:hypothetical protein [Pelistega sp.]
MHTATSTHPIASFPSLANPSSVNESMATPHLCQGHNNKQGELTKENRVQENMAQESSELAQLAACSHIITPSSSLLTVSVLGRTWPVMILLLSMWFLSFLVLGWI